MRNQSRALVVSSILVAATAHGACVNKFTSRTQGNLQNVTLLTGMLNFAEARQLAAAIRDGKANPLQWVDSRGKRIAEQWGALRVIRPMPVACESNSSGVIMTVSFANAVAPTKKMLVKLGEKRVVEFEQQRE